MLSTLYKNYPQTFPLPLVLDGSTGTSLMREGMPSGSCTEKWVLEHPDVLRKIQRGYINSGSDALYAPTFGANRPTLERSDITDVPEINEKLASLTVGSGVLTGGDMSPPGLFIEPFGDTPFDEVVAAYREQAEALDKAGVDFFISETNISLNEARAAVIGIREVSDKPIFVTMTVDDSGRTLSGDDLVCCLLTLAELGISAFGTHCSQGPDGMLDLLKTLVPYSLSLGIPLIAKPNAGLPHEDEQGQRHFDLDADSFAKYVPEFLDAGIPILGGCCGTDSEFISKIRAAVDAAVPDYSRVTPVDTSNLACNNRIICDGVDLGAPVKVKECFFDDVCMEEHIVFAELEDMAAADIFIETAPMLSVPCAVTGDAAAIDKARRYYNGKLLVIR